MNQGKRCGLVWLYYPFPRVICSISFLALEYAYIHLLLCTNNEEKWSNIYIFWIKNAKFLLKNKLKFMTLLGALLSLGYFVETETYTFFLHSHFWLCPFPLNGRRQSLLERPNICDSSESTQEFHSLSAPIVSLLPTTISLKNPCISTPQNSKVLHLTVQPGISDWKPITLAN